MSKKRFTLRELENNNLEVSRSVSPMVHGLDVGVMLIPVGGNLFKLPKGWKFVDYHGYWLLSKGGR